MTIKTKTQSKKGAAKAPVRKGPSPKIGEWMPWALGTVVIVALAVGVWWGIKQQYKEDTPGKFEPVLASVGKPDAPAVIDVYEDFMCPACAEFEGAYGEQIAKAVEDGKLRVQYHMLNFLNRNSASGDYSSRAAGAALAVFQKAPDKFLAFHTKMFSADTQPREGSESDLSNDQLAKIAESVGAGAAAADIRSGADVKAAAGSAQAAIKQLQSLTKSVSTPTVLKDNKPLNWQRDDQWLQKIVGGPALTQTPAQTSTPAQTPAPKPAG
ncbi:DSBA oxidoreductase [Segniliparus rotundus DSM 44985]|uniref:DSBA oxidoreductase n=1 Tax=Segniliparus rotundus (strain ATCC BAA-972 / CDC 1076 / CIP 108378 / DSM 44985 / JCM 13578) TaxID=640132 RepID=D6Z9F7_SEGRD|nr:thioredoxin domain-containing protein [Segniliparus rotundus]ADG98587.1 DSBA oxidoreductase [Segniliparus rotundus DSM 44985]